MEEEKKTYIATVCHIEKINAPTGDELLICIPIEIIEGELTDSKCFADSEGGEILPAYEAYLKGQVIGYILEVSYDEILSRGKHVLVDAMGYSFKGSKIRDEVVQNYKDEYISNVEETVYYYDLKDIVAVLTYVDDKTFYRMYNISINRGMGKISTDKPDLKPLVNAYIDEDYDDEEAEDELDEDLEEVEEESKPKVKISRVGLIAETKKYVISQDEAIEKIVSAVYNPIALGEPRLKRNILLYGPTGVGKTFILEKIAEQLDLPFFEKSVADFSATGYVGSSVEDLYRGLYRAAGRDIKKLEKGGVLFLDEVDKLIISSGDSDVKSHVYNELLPVYQHGGFVSFKASDQGPMIKYNKENLIIVSAGSFSRVAEARKKQVGFGDNGLREDVKYLSKKDFEKFGVPIEWLGRQDLCIPLNALKEEDLYKILTESLESPYLIMVETLKLKGITLDIPKSALMKMAKKAYELKTGARTLNGVFGFAVEDELNHVVDMIDSGSLTDTTYKVDEEQIVKQLERYNG